MSNTIRVGIAGAAGYTGGELIRLLVQHPYAELVFAHSESNAGKPVHTVHTDLLGTTELYFTDVVSHDVDVLFLCTGHGRSAAFLQQHALPAHIRVIDLGQDFRLRSEASKHFVYGLPELNRSSIAEARTQHYHVANPGCFATCIQLGLLPLAAHNLLANDVHTTAITGSTGAGQAPSATTHFSWRNGNAQVYNVFTHRHLAEIRQSIEQLVAFPHTHFFVPMRGSFARGILATSYTHCAAPHDEIRDMFRSYYASHPFVHVSDVNPDVKQTVNTNNCVLYTEKHGDTLLVVGVLDNLLKGASGQAVQNMNILCNVDETAGLKLKASVF